MGNAIGEGAKRRPQVQNHPEGMAHAEFLKLKIGILTTRQDVLVAAPTVS